LARYQFAKQPGELFGDWNLTFDIKSAMFYEGNVGAIASNKQVMKAKNGEELRCKPHECPTELDIIKINTVYNCQDYLTKIPQVNNISGPNNTHSCPLLRWKTRINVQQSDNPVVSRKIGHSTHLTCRALLFNGEFKSGETNGDNSKCIITYIGLGFSWFFSSYDLLINPFNQTIEWRKLDATTIKSNYEFDGRNMMTVDTNKGKKTYVTKCSQSKRLLKYLNLCLVGQVLVC